MNTKWKLLLTLAVCGLLGSVTLALPYRVDRGMDSIINVESGGDPKAVGDHGRSHGLAQISYPYYVDAVRQMKKHGLTPPPYREAVQSRYWSKLLMHYYMERYCPKALAKGDLVTMSRVHNGGVNGARKPQTKKYAARVLEDFNDH